MPVLQPFRALRPVADRASAVAAPPYDVVDVPEARALAAGNTDSFLHVSRPEIDLPEGSSTEAVHTQGRAFLDALVERGVLVKDAVPTLTVYRQRRPDGTGEQTGVVGLAQVTDYRLGLIAVHEHTRPDKEDDRTDHMVALDAHDEPVILMYPARPEIDALVEGITRRAPDLDVVGPDGVLNTLWTVSDPGEVSALGRAFEAVPRLYVADGHHRSAAAARLHEKALADAGETDGFPVVAFPAEQLTVLPYQRVVAGPLPDGVEGLLASLAERFEITGSPAAPDPARHEFGLYAGGRWRLLTARPDTIDDADPIARLDVAVLQDRVLRPLLGIDDPRTDPRIAFIGGSRGTGELERLVDDGTFAVAFALHPTSPAEVMAVADGGLVMPPKSTWFDPKLVSGLFVHRLR
ncbi:MAG: hypothetical protein QG622_1728 [Actinomycetota bacterium]|nr:hypothetical protein [Actinomycetota bacterium]